MIYFAKLFLSMTFVLIFVVSAYSEETSFYDSNLDLIIRAYKNSSNTLSLEVRNKNGSLQNDAKINGSSNPQTIANDVNSFSMAYDTNGSKAYILYMTDPSYNNPTIKTYEISKSGVPKIVANYTNIHYLDININSYYDHTVIFKNEGTAPGNIGAINISGQYFTRTGGTCTANQILAVNQSCTVIVRFAPETNGQFTGKLTVGTININLYGNGVGGGQSGADVIITRIDHNCWSNEEDINTSVQLLNQGTSAATNFKYTISIQRNNDLYPDSPPKPEYSLGSWDIDNINPNETKVIQRIVRFSGLPIHFEYFLKFRVVVAGKTTEAKARCFLGR